MMNKRIIDLQMFGEGGGAGASGAAGAEGGAEGAALSPGVADQGGEDLSAVMYGKSNPAGDSTTPTEDKSKTFENMIRKGGEFAEEFNKRTQDIINKRFRETKNLENQLKSTQDIMNVLASKYGVDPKDTEALTQAIDADTSMYEELAFKEGLTVEQYKEKQKLQKELDHYREAEEQAKMQQHTDAIVSQWMEQGNAMAQKYGINNFDFNAEVNNPAMTALLGAGVDFEGAYKAVHFDDMVGGAMAQTAATVEQNLANRVASRHSRPTENGVESSNTTTFTTDVSKMSDADINDLIKRARNGEIISLNR